MKSSDLIVIKIGGTEGVDYTSICQDVLNINQNQRVILVHGGSSEANNLGIDLGVPPKFIISPSGFNSRYTDRQTLEIFLMAVNGKINSLLVEQLQGLGLNACGLSGLDGRLIQAKRKEAVQSVENGKRKIIRDDFTGKINRVDPTLLNLVLDNDYLPVIAPVAVGEHGEALNVDADRAAAMVAAEMKADYLVLLTAVEGLMRDFPNADTLIHHLSPDQLESAMDYAQGRMKKKVLGALEAVQGGVRHVIIGDGRVDSPVSLALAGHGTHIY